MFDDKAAKQLGKKKHQKSKEEVLEKARADRAERKRLREAATHVVRLQTWHRGRSAKSKQLAAQRADFDTKLSTIQTLKAALAAQGVAFVPPAGAKVKSIIQQSNRLRHLCVYHRREFISAGGAASLLQPTTECGRRQAPEPAL
jgi:hypothetical protein